MLNTTDTLVLEPEIRQNIVWFRACAVTDVPEDGGVNVLYKGEQIAIFNFASRGEWYATQNMCPHRMQMALSRGMVGDSNGEPKVACPFHKKTYSLKTGCNMNGEDYTIKTYSVKIVNDVVFIGVEEGGDH